MIKVAKVVEGAKLPTRKHPLDAGIDLYAYLEDRGTIYVAPNAMLVIRTGVSIETPKGCVGFIWPKSRNNHLIGGGVVDAGYTGEILVKVVNISNEPLRIQEGDAIAQYVLQAGFTGDIKEVSITDLYKTDRGNTGGIVGQVKWD